LTHNLHPSVGLKQEDGVLTVVLNNNSPEAGAQSGTARSKVWAQILADITGRAVRPLARPVDAGALGAAIVCGVGLGALARFEDADGLIPEGQSVQPRPEFGEMYDRQFEAFATLHKATRRINRRLMQEDV
jgi:sugar (pentulose or hexulose) kinase